MEDESNIPREEPQERREHPRFAVDASAMLCIVSSPYAGVPAHVIDLSETGCCIRTERPFKIAADTHVEVSFKVLGIGFRVSGITKWSEGRRLIGVSFASMSSRRKVELIDLLGELEAKLAEQAAKEATEELPVLPEEPADIVSVGLFAVPEGMSEDQLEEPVEMIDPELELEMTAQLEAQLAKPPIPFDSGKNKEKQERRAQIRHEVDSRATVYLVNVRAVLHGTILDVSLGGCRIRADEPLLLGIYQRVEVGFMLDGLPFRLPGVTQSVHNRFTVGVRFLDLSQRKQEQLGFLIEEIEELRQEGKLDSEQVEE